MDHDPLCPTQTMCKCKDQECWDCRDVVLCQCDLIRDVREDQDRRNAAAELTRLGQEMGLIP